MTERLVPTLIHAAILGVVLAAGVALGVISPEWAVPWWAGGSIGYFGGTRR